MKKTYLALCAGLMLLTTGCASVATPVGCGVIYTDVTSGVTATSNSLGKKIGTGSAKNVLGLFATGDASIETAARQGGIKKISHVDAKRKTILGIYSSYTVKVYGE